MVTNFSHQPVRKTIHINASPARVWAGLTTPALMQQWMAESKIEILTDWQVDSPFLIRGHLHRMGFENRGKVLQFEPEHLLQYSHLSSLSRLPDEPQSYSLIEFRLTKVADDQTDLVLTLSNFPTAAIYHHLDFYWNSALALLKQLSEQKNPQLPL